MAKISMQNISVNAWTGQMFSYKNKEKDYIITLLNYLKKLVSELRLSRCIIMHGSVLSLFRCD